ncbi:glycosyltransferase [Pleurocapsales cyanobacterium LEGE 06147]|nr:glycosyltransferase [Pleurocapsales cyanobacterium LEGE 06147]
MKIAIIASGFLPVIDGVTVSGFSRLEKLSQWGHQVLFFCPDYSCLEPLYPNWQDYTGNILPGVRVVSLKSMPFFVDFETNIGWGAYRQLLEELRQFQPEIIHVDEPERLFIGIWRFVELKYARQAGIPCVGFFRTNFLEYIEDFLPLPNLLLKLPKFLVKKLITFVYNRYDATLVSSTITQQKLIQLGINNLIYGNFLGFDRDKFHPTLRQANFFAHKYGLTEVERQVKLIFLGRLTPDKGWDFTLDTLPQIFQQIEPDKIAILIVGDGEMKEEIVTRLGKFTPHVHLLGRVSPDKIPAILANSDLHVTASEKETRGLTIIEAFASGIPVLAPRAGGVRENIEDGINGFCFTPQDKQDFIHKLKLLIENPTLRQEMGLRGRNLVASKYSWDETVGNLLHVWQEQITVKSTKNP